VNSTPATFSGTGMSLVSSSRHRTAQDVRPALGFSVELLRQTAAYHWATRHFPRAATRHAETAEPLA
jgi:hypothetical protein